MKYKKFFLSPVKEEAWLNSMAKSGLILVNKADTNYYFEQDENASSYRYSIEFLELVADTEESRAYFAQREAMGEYYVCSAGLKAYFATKDGFKTESCLKAAETRRIYFRDRALVFSSIYFVILGLLTYNLIKWVQFDAQGLDGMDALGFIAKAMPWLSDYFGNYPSTPLIILFLFLLVLVFVPTFWFVEEYISAKKAEAVLKKAEATAAVELEVKDASSDEACVSEDGEV